MTYYFFTYCYSHHHATHTSVHNAVCAGEHPFTVVGARNKKADTIKHVLVSWQEITQDEFDLYKTDYSERTTPRR